MILIVEVILLFSFEPGGHKETVNDEKYVKIQFQSFCSHSISEPKYPSFALLSQTVPLRTAVDCNLYYSFIATNAKDFQSPEENGSPVFNEDLLEELKKEAILGIEGFDKHGLLFF